MRLRFGSSKYFIRLVTFTILLGIIPAILVGMFSYDRSTSIIQQNVTASHYQLLKQIQLNVEKTLTIIDNSTVQLMTSPLVSESLASHMPASNFFVINDLAAYLRRLQTFELGIMNVHLVSYVQNWVINNDGIRRYKELGQPNPFLPYKDLPNKKLWYTSAELEFGDATNDRVPHIQLVRKLPIHTQEPDGILVVSLPVKEITRLMAGNAELGKVFLLDERMRPIGRVDFPHEPIAEAISARQEGQGDFLMDVDGQSYGITYIRSAFNGWTYVDVVELEKLTSQSRSIGWFTIWVCFGISLLIIVIAWLVSKGMYSPIRAIYNALVGEAKPPKEDGSFDELHVIDERIRALKQSYTRLSTEVDRQSAQMKELFVHKLLQGNISQSEIADKLDQFRYGEWEHLCVFALEIDTLKDTRYAEEDLDLLMFAINNMVGDIVPPGNRLQPVVHSRYQVTVLGTEQQDADAFRKEAVEIAEKIQRTVMELLQLKVSIGISRMFTDYRDIPNAYRMGQDALKYKIRLGYETILCIEDVMPDQAGKAPHTDWLEKELLDAVKTADEERAHQLLAQWIQEIAGHDVPYKESQLRLNHLLIKLLLEVRETESLQGTYFSLQDQLYQQRTPEEIESWFMQYIILPAIRDWNRKNESLHKSISSEVARMIDEEYDTDLTLESCAGRLNYHPSYVRSVFRKEMGVTFSDYLIRRRLDAAKAWLVETDMKIGVIAEKLQYNNAQNFIRLFRKMEGMTPGQYRKQYGQSDTE